MRPINNQHLPLKAGDTCANFVQDTANLVMDIVYVGCNAFSLVSCLLECLKAPASAVVSAVPVVGVAWNLLDALGSMAIAVEQSQKSQKEESQSALWNVISATQLTTLTLPQLLSLLPAFQSMMVGTMSLSQLGAVTGGWGFVIAMAIGYHIENQALQQHHESIMSLLGANDDSANDSDSTVAEESTDMGCGSLKQNYTAWKKHVDELWYCPVKRREAKDRLMKSVTEHSKVDEIERHITAIEKHDRARRIWAGCTVTMGLVVTMTSLKLIASVATCVACPWVGVGIAALAVGWAAYRHYSNVQSTAAEVTSASEAEQQQPAAVPRLI